MTPSDPDITQSNHHTKQRDKLDEKLRLEYDGLLLKSLIDSLQNYYLVTCQISGVSLKDLPDSTLPNTHAKINNLKEINHTQKTLLHNALAIKKLHNLSLRLYSKTEQLKNNVDSSNIISIFNFLPKTELIINFISRISIRYGKYQNRLQNKHPDIFRFQSKFALQQHSLIGNVLYLNLRVIYPKVFSENVIEKYIKHNFKDKVVPLHSAVPEPKTNTTWFSKLLQLCHQSQQKPYLSEIDLSTKNWLEYNNLSFLSSQIESFNQRNILRDIAELVALEPKVDFVIKPEMFSHHISEIVLAKYQQLQNILDKIYTKANNIEANIKSIIDFLTTFMLLTPVAEVTTNDDLIIMNQSQELNQDNLTPIIKSINTLIIQPDIDKIKIDKELNNIQELLNYSTLIAQQSRDILFRNIQSKIAVSRRYRSNSVLIDDIIKLNQRLNEITSNNEMLANNYNPTSIPGYKSNVEPDKTKLYESNNTLLFDLLRERIEIKLNNPPTAKTENWDDYLINLKNSTDKGARSPSYFLQKFPSTIEQQLNTIHGLNQLQSDLYKLIGKVELLPRLDPEPILSKKIAGQHHIKEYYIKILEKRNNLLAFVQYLNLKSITLELSTVNPESNKDNQTIHTINLLCKSLKEKQSLQQPLTKTVTPLQITSELLHKIYKDIAEISPKPKNLTSILKIIQLFNNFMYPNKINGAIIKKDSLNTDRKTNSITSKNNNKRTIPDTLESNTPDNLIKSTFTIDNLKKLATANKHDTNGDQKKSSKPNVQNSPTESVLQSGLNENNNKHNRQKSPNKPTESHNIASKQATKTAVEYNNKYQPNVDFSEFDLIGNKTPDKNDKDNLDS